MMQPGQRQSQFGIPHWETAIFATLAIAGGFRFAAGTGEEPKTQFAALTPTDDPLVMMVGVRQPHRDWTRRLNEVMVFKDWFGEILPDAEFFARDGHSCVRVTEVDMVHLRLMAA